MGRIAKQTTRKLSMSALSQLRLPTQRARWKRLRAEDDPTCHRRTADNGGRRPYQTISTMIFIISRSQRYGYRPQVALLQYDPWLFLSPFDALFTASFHRRTSPVCFIPPSDEVDSWPDMPWSYWLLSLIVVPSIVNIRLGVSVQSPHALMRHAHLPHAGLLNCRPQMLLKGRLPVGYQIFSSQPST